jgi:pilus assembly protein CpaC
MRTRTWRWAPFFGALILLGGPGGLAQPAAEQANELRLVLGRSLILEHPDDIVRISVASPEVVDAVAVSTREVLLNGKSSGTTSVVLWSKAGDRQFFTVTVDPSIDGLQRQILQTFPGESVQIHAQRDSITLTGRVSSAAVAERVAALAASAARTVVNHMEVTPPPVEKQILLRVRFAEINRVALHELGVNLLSTGALNTPGTIGTQQFGPPRASELSGMIGGRVTGTLSDFTLNDVLNVFAFRPDLNLAVLLKALEGRNLLQILAEPNLITTNGKEATFLAGGEFPFPVLQGGANAGSITVQFREFGVRVSFLPQVTAHDTIRMHVRPEVSSLDFANAVTLSGFLIPALSTRRVETDIELAAGQSFVIGGLVDQRVTENLSRIPGLANIPLLGNIFKSRSESKNKSELLVLVTPEFPSVLAAGEPRPTVEFPKEFLPPPPPRKK